MSMLSRKCLEPCLKIGAKREPEDAISGGINLLLMRLLNNGNSGGQSGQMTSFVLVT